MDTDYFCCKFQFLQTIAHSADKCPGYKDIFKKLKSVLEIVLIIMLIGMTSLEVKKLRRVGRIDTLRIPTDP